MAGKATESDGRLPPSATCGAAALYATPYATPYATLYATLYVTLYATLYLAGHCTSPGLYVVLNVQC